MGTQVPIVTTVPPNGRPCGVTTYSAAQLRLFLKENWELFLPPKVELGREQWLTPVILDTSKGEIRRIEVPGQTG
jgi:hypothetical protein